MFFFHLGWPWDVTSILSLTGFWKLCSTSFIYYNITHSNCPQRMVSMWYFSFRWIPIESCWYYSISRLLPRVLVKAFTVNDRKMFFFFFIRSKIVHFTLWRHDVKETDWNRVGFSWKIFGRHGSALSVGVISYTA